MTDHEVTVPMDSELHEDIVEQLEYGDSKAGWIRQAAREKLARDAKNGGESGNEPRTADIGAD